MLAAAPWDVPAVRKERVAKGYRLPALDQRLRAQRTALEASLLARAKRAGVRVPRVLAAERTALVLERIEGPRLKEALNGAPERERRGMAAGLGEALGKLHAAGVAHGDATTSNAIWNNGVWLIDFGLGRATQKAEDFAMDLYVLKGALAAAHSKVQAAAWREAVAAYRKAFPAASAALAQLAKVEKRRRYGG